MKLQETPFLGVSQGVLFPLQKGTPCLGSKQLLETECKGVLAPLDVKIKSEYYSVLRRPEGTSKNTDNQNQGIPGPSSGQDFKLSLPAARVQVQSLVRELRSCKLQGMDKKEELGFVTIPISANVFLHNYTSGFNLFSGKSNCKCFRVIYVHTTLIGA